jgi:hypothetical protein
MPGHFDDRWAWVADEQNPVIPKFPNCGNAQMTAGGQVVYQAGSSDRPIHNPMIVVVLPCAKPAIWRARMIIGRRSSTPLVRPWLVQKRHALELRPSARLRERSARPRFERR